MGEKKLPPSYDEATTKAVVAGDRPGAAECEAHLRLLAAFADLRDVVAERDGLFGLWDISAPDKDALALLREKRWGVYVARAADRFEDWYTHCVPQTEAPLTVHGVERHPADPLAGSPIVWTTDTLPPLDIIMVWHAYALNPLLFLEDSVRMGRLGFWRAGFPLAEIAASINGDLEFSVPPNEFVKLTGRHWRNEDDGDKRLACPQCGTGLTAPWTTTRGPGNSAEADDLFADGRGFADGNFAAQCTCGAVVTHEALRVAKFHADVDVLFRDQVPLPGTVLPTTGFAYKTASPEHTYANHLLHSKPRAFWEASSVDDVRRAIQGMFESLDEMVRVRGSRLVTHGMAERQRVSIRRMLASYWGNSSPFGLDLVGAVLRQGVFVRKMDELDWLHAPTCSATLARAAKKYAVFLDIVAHGERMAVPTLDVDLVWHTHQLGARAYFAHCTALTGALVDHDDKVAEGKLSDAFEWTCREFEKRTGGQVYSECTCWYCEAVRSPDVKLFADSLTKAVRRNAEHLHAKAPEGAPSSRAHISSHNAVEPTGMRREEVQADEVRRRRLHKQFEKAARRLRKRGIRLASIDTPTEDPKLEFYRAWGVAPHQIAYFEPFISDWCVTASASMYADDPLRANFARKTAGNCVGGTCSGRISAGACASGACAGGPVGGPYAGCVPLISAEFASGCMGGVGSVMTGVF